MAKIEHIKIPDIGGTSNVSVIEVLVKPGDVIKVEDSLITLESEKASMDVPSPMAGTVKAIQVKVGDKVEEGVDILTLEVSETSAAQQTREIGTTSQEAPIKKTKETPHSVPDSIDSLVRPGNNLYASPIVRRLAREFDIDLSHIPPTGRKARLTKLDIQNYVKTQLAKAKSGGMHIPSAPLIDFSKFGSIETKSLNKIKRLTGQVMHHSWITVPHVTQFAEADITELEAFRKSQKSRAEREGFKLTLLVFLMKAVVACLKKFPIFNSSLDHTGEKLIFKKYFHIGIAVDTPLGLVVPVIRNVDQKDLFDLAKELREISKKAREKGLTPVEMAGSCFTISSLGGIGGTVFTPIVKTPDVAILGVSKAEMKPIYENDKLIPRLMLPLSLSYDHRVIDGADGARFIVALCQNLSELDAKC